MDYINFTGRVKFVEGGLFDDEVAVSVPTEEQIRVVALRLRNCQYYYTGIDNCRQENIGKSDFQACRPLIDSYYQCISQGGDINEAPQNFRTFLQCAFQDLKNLDSCKRFVKETVYDLYDAGKLKDTQI